MNKQIKMSALAILLTVVVIAAGSAQTTILQENNIESGKEGLLNVYTESADVAVSVWKKHRVLVTVEGLKKTEKILDIQVQKTDTGVSVSVKKDKERKLLGWGGIQFTRVTIVVPEAYMINTVTSGGDIQINNVGGKMELDSGGGDITVTAGAAPIRAFSSGGDISISGNNGDIDLSSGGGNIRALMVIGSVQATSDNGDIMLESSNGSISAYSAAGDCSITYHGENRGIEARTTRGDLSLIVPGTVKAALSIDTGSGTIFPGFDSARVTAKSTLRYEAELNGGGKEIRLRTERGNISAGPAE